ncbi:ABC transporter permease [Caulobacter sp. 17J80-11]|uniref:ABC transporter permease n=1 Tax=Caulobacter sp. 17J80-11 TaxID=2763502 RepID=UPI001653786C|nr:ABC transporter permease [Caulobacter sp. 17J80-11]MBC6980993.1 ABC transporter permease [Caulobacter sp. 17J80-11]
MSLALSTLIYEWRRYTAAIVALSMAGVLVLAQVGLFMGINKAFTATIDRSPAHIMILGPKSESMLQGTGVPRRIKPQIYLNPEVVAVSDLDGDGARWNNLPTDGSKQKREFVNIITVDPIPGAVTLPTDFPEAAREAITEPRSVVVDRSALTRLGVKLGDQALMNGKKVRVVYVVETYPNLAQPMVFVSRDTLQMLGLNRKGPDGAALVVKVADPARAEIVRDQLNAVSKGQYRAWTREELSKANEQALLKDQFIGLFLVASVILGLFIGVIITFMTLRGAVFANIKEFASLRALGVSMGSLRWIVIELSFWVGVFGLGSTWVVMWGVTALGAANGLPMAYPLWSVILAVMMLMTIAVLSGVFSLGILKKAQPADLLR